MVDGAAVADKLVRICAAVAVAVAVVVAVVVRIDVAVVVRVVHLAAGLQCVMMVPRRPFSLTR